MKRVKLKKLRRVIRPRCAICNIRFLAHSKCSFEMGFKDCQPVTGGFVKLLKPPVKPSSSLRMPVQQASVRSVPASSVDSEIRQSQHNSDDLHAIGMRLLFLVAIILNPEDRVCVLSIEIRVNSIFNIEIRVNLTVGWPGPPLV